MIGIYKITNQINKKVYIGQSICIEYRWQQHKADAMNEKSRCYNRPLYRAIRKYGIENFEFAVLEECSPDKLNEKEIYWINYYNSFNQDYGYNLTLGGNQAIKIVPDELYKLWDEGYSIHELIEHFHVNHTTIDKWLKMYENYSEKEAFRRGFFRSEKRRNIKKHEKRICQYSLDGEFIQYWDSIKSISRALQKQGACSSIPKCLKGEYYSSYGFRWCYEGKKLVSKQEVNQRTNLVKLTIEDVAEIKEMLAQGAKQQEIANLYNVGRSAITDINIGRHWNDGGIYPIYNFKKKQPNR